MIQPLPTPPTATDRAALSTLLRAAVGSTLRPSAETAARAHGRTPLVLDTGATGHALNPDDHDGYPAPAPAPATPSTPPARSSTP